MKEESTLEIIRRLTKVRKERNIFPTHILFVRLVRESSLSIKDLKVELNELFHSGFVTVGKTLNDKYIKLIED